MSAISFKTPRQLKEFGECEPLLQEILHFIAENLWPPNLAMMITSIYRTIQENNDAHAQTEVHCFVPHRAADIRAWLLLNPALNHIVETINQTYDYNHDGHPTALAHDLGSGLHVHVQVFPGSSHRRT